MKSIAIVQTALGSSKELWDLCAEIMPEVKVYQIIDDSMLPEMLKKGGPTPDVRRRMYAYYQQAQSLGVDAILHQCVVAGEIAAMAQPFLDIPVVRIDEGMLRKALTYGGRIEVFCTAKAAVKPSCDFLKQLAASGNKNIEIDSQIVAKDTIKKQAEAAAASHDVIVLAQPSMTALLPELASVQVPVLTAPRLGVEYLKTVLDV